MHAGAIHRHRAGHSWSLHGHARATAKTRSLRIRSVSYFQRSVSREISPASSMARLVVVCGHPSKSILLDRLDAEFPDIFERPVAHTSRRPRTGEVDREDFKFVTREKVRAHCKTIYSASARSYSQTFTVFSRVRVCNLYTNLYTLCKTFPF